MQRLTARRIRSLEHLDYEYYLPEQVQNDIFTRNGNVHFRVLQTEEKHSDLHFESNGAMLLFLYAHPYRLFNHNSL